MRTNEAPWRASPIATITVLAAMLLGACGSEEQDTGTSARPPAAAVISEDLAFKAPERLTCGDVATTTIAAGKATRAAANGLATRVRLRDASQYQTAQRLIYAFNDLCKKARDESYRPAQDALQAVKRGRYQLSRQ